MLFTRITLLTATIAAAFTTAQSVPPSEQVVVASPNSTSVWKAGASVTVAWRFLLADAPFTNDGFDISLRKGDIAANTTVFVRALGRSGRGSTSLTLDLPADILNGSDYQIGVGPYSSESFVILGTTSAPPSSTASPPTGTFPTASGKPPTPTTDKPGSGATRGFSASPLTLARSAVVMMAVVFAL
ncbi:hypothetical protein FBU30_002079 [Linnemannia zychae]|nr:hypothetical protein FBU30_002079 [Linnemannia zychae]